MKKILIFSILAISLLAISCSGTKKSTTENKSMEPVSLYSVKVLNADIPSPKKELTATLGGSDLTIVYGSPSTRGRDLWGALVPFDAVWRTGANEATTFEVSKKVQINGQQLPAGKYGFFTIPKANGDWILIFNNTSEQWGAYEYDQAEDALRVAIKTRQSDVHSETMEFKVTDKNTVTLHWGNMLVPFKVAVQ